MYGRWSKDEKQTVRPSQVRREIYAVLDIADVMRLSLILKFVAAPPVSSTPGRKEKARDAPR